MGIECGDTHNMPALSIVSATLCGILMLFVIPLNSIIVYFLLNERKKKYKSLFYKLLLNIAIADLLTGLTVIPISVNFLYKEALDFKQLQPYEISGLHVTLFFTDAAALVTLTVLSIERIVAIIKPFRHHVGMNGRNENIIVAVVWPIAFVLVSPYFEINYIRQLAVFASVNITVCILSLLVTTATYRYKSRDRKISNVTITTENLAVCKDNQGHLHAESLPLTDHKRSLTPRTFVKFQSFAIKSQKKVTKTFIYTLCVFLMTYLPTCVTMIYMNFCEPCDCIAVHIMRDVSMLCILSSSLLRPINFIRTLRHLRSSVGKIFKKLKRTSKIEKPADI